MIKEHAIVIASDSSIHGRVAVRVDRKSACESCQMKAGCGQKLVNNSSERKCIEFELDDTIGLKVGDRVTLAIPEKSFIQASVVMYILPLIFMIFGAVLGESFFNFDEGGVFLLSLSGFVAGLFMVRRFANRHQFDPDFHPQIIAQESESTPGESLSFSAISEK